MSQSPDTELMKMSSLNTALGITGLWHVQDPLVGRFQKCLLWSSFPVHVFARSYKLQMVVGKMEWVYIVCLLDAARLLGTPLPKRLII